jgi:hypothetical protein
MGGRQVPALDRAKLEAAKSEPKLDQPNGHNDDEIPPAIPKHVGLPHWIYYSSI